MVDEEKVLRMTKMASYEEHGGKRDKAVGRFFKRDYLGMQTVISFVVITIAFMAAFGTWLLFNFEEVMANIYTMDVVATGRRLLLIYLAVLLVYLAATYIVYMVRYVNARKRLNRFLEYLNCLDDTEEEDDI